ncbi:MAG: sulfotransferase [Acidimicrobiia bacterium]|nr:sulfotransferase [Acidimicrobiia bacterium]
MAVVASSLRDAVRTVSPRSRRYQQLLDSCDLEPSQVAGSAPPGADVIICGCPRSGTALVTAALHQPPAMVTVMEPWDGLRLEPAQLFDSLRQELAGGWLRRGRLDLGALADRGEVAWTAEGRPQAVQVDDSTLLGVKWPTYWQLLPMLPDTRFVVTVRHPADVVDSFARQPGRLRDGLEYDVAFNRSLNAALGTIDSIAERRLALYDAANRTVLEHAHRPNVHIVRYEDWHHDRDGVLHALSRFLNRDLTTSPVRVTDHRPDSRERHDQDGLRAAVVDASLTARDLGY